MPPARTGPATDSAELVAALAADHEIDVFVHRLHETDPTSAGAARLRSAHDFIWEHQQRPYDLTVFQLGNSSHHDYIWPYLFRYPGLTVLHDAHLHHARAASLLRNERAHDYRVELAWNHPDANPDVAELAIAGYDNHLHYVWPMTRLVALSSKLVAVHGAEVAQRLREMVPDAAERVESVQLGHGTSLTDERAAELRRRTRKRYAIADSAIVFGCYGGLTPEKRLPQVMAAFAATRAFVPSAHLLLAGAVPSHYDAHSDIARCGLERCTTLTGYLQTDDELTECVAACDVALNLRWPTAREISGPWLRCLAAGKPTIVCDLAHLVDVPTIDPRTWLANTTVRESPSDNSTPCAVAIDILDEDHSLRLAMRRLGTDAALRASLGTAARQYWTRHHSVDVMVAGYRRLLEKAARMDAPAPRLPDHLTDTGTRTLDGVMEQFGLQFS